MCTNTDDRATLTALRDDPRCPHDVRSWLDRALASGNPIEYAGAIRRARELVPEGSRYGLWLRVMACKVEAPLRLPVRMPSTATLRAMVLGG